MLNSISNLGETRPEQEWSNGTEFSGYSNFQGILVQRREVHPKFRKKFRKMSVPFASKPGILVEWKAPLIFRGCKQGETKSKLGCVLSFHEDAITMPRLKFQKF